MPARKKQTLEVEDSGYAESEVEALTRNKRKAAATKPKAYVEMDTSEYEESELEPPPRKKRKAVSKVPDAKYKTRGNGKGKSRIRGKTGRLAFLLETPMEIVLEILSYLTPIDILHLSYVDKELRALLTAPSANSVWVTARKNVPGLPECPPDFTEPAYARFLFLRKCEMCDGIARGLDEMPFVRVRLCGRCSKSDLVDGMSVRETLEMDWEDEVDLLPRAAPNGDDWSWSETQLFFRPAVMKLITEMGRLNTVDELNEFKDTKRKYIANLMEHAGRLSDWLNQIRRAAQRDSRTMRQNRLESIRSRLVELGHDRRDMESADFLRHRVVAQSADLTDRAWPKVRHHLEGIVEENKTQRLRHELLQRNTRLLNECLRGLYEGLPSNFEKQTFPPLLNLIGLPSVQSLHDMNASEEDLIAAFQSVISWVRQDIEELQVKIRADLVDLWNRQDWEKSPAKSLSSRDRETDRQSSQFLRLASTVFACSKRGCNLPLHYAYILSHPAHNAWLDSDNESETEEDRPALVRKFRWSVHLARLRVTFQSRRIMSAIISAAGLDESSATLEDLEAIGPQFYLCSKGIDSTPGPWQRVYRALMARHKDQNHYLDDWSDYESAFDSSDSDSDDSLMDFDITEAESSNSGSGSGIRFHHSAPAPQVKVVQTEKRK